MFAPKLILCSYSFYSQVISNSSSILSLSYSFSFYNLSFSFSSGVLLLEIFSSLLAISNLLPIFVCLLLTLSFAMIFFWTGVSLTTFFFDFAGAFFWLWLDSEISSGSLFLTFYIAQLALDVSTNSSSVIDDEDSHKSDLRSTFSFISNCFFSVSSYKASLFRKRCMF